MRRFTIAAATALLLAGLAAPGQVRAMSIGVYAGAGDGAADFDNSDGDGFIRTHDTRHTGGGVVFDASTPRHPLGYRLSLGWERIVNDPAGAEPGLTMQGLVVDQDLTVNLLNSPGQLRLWAGPELRLGFLKGSPDGVPGGDQDFLAIGIGPVLGLDIDVGPALLVSWKLGYLVTSYSGDRGSTFDSRDDTTLSEGHAFANIALLFRTWGGYRERPAP
ncbi:MAG TPA: hypothetical protein VN317_00305, partial [Candidatus Methanoperedens sp.]|nr:hypothetical protein [Candidatus Methanoperedens sp.]